MMWCGKDYNAAATDDDDDDTTTWFLWCFAVAALLRQSNENISQIFSFWNMYLRYGKEKMLYQDKQFEKRNKQSSVGFERISLLFSIANH